MWLELPWLIEVNRLLSVEEWVRVVPIRLQLNGIEVRVRHLPYPIGTSAPSGLRIGANYVQLVVIDWEHTLGSVDSESVSK